MTFPAWSGGQLHTCEPYITGISYSCHRLSLFGALIVCLGLWLMVILWLLSTLLISVH